MRTESGEHQQSSVNEIIVDASEAADLRLARLLYCDLAGILRGRATHAAGISDRLVEGVGLPQAVMAMDALDRIADDAGIDAAGEVRLLPDPETFTILPYAPRSGMFLCDMLTLDRQAWQYCPRAALRSVLEHAEDPRLSVEAVFEAEYYLATASDDGVTTTLVPVTAVPGFSSRSMQLAAGFMDDLLVALEAQSISVEEIQPERGPGQYEISVRHAPALQAADTYLIVKETVRAIAAQNDRVATFAPAPFAGLPGSGAHIHLSLWDTQTGENRLYDPDADRGFSDDGRRFVAGILAHLPALMALTCASANSYRRTGAGFWSGAVNGWGFDDRDQAVRIPSTYWGREQGTTNIELRTVDNTCNPYLALAGVIAAGISGLEDGLDAPAPGASSESRRRRDTLPASFAASLDALDHDDVLREALGDRLVDAYVAVRRQEISWYDQQTDETEQRDHALRY